MKTKISIKNEFSDDTKEFLIYFLLFFIVISFFFNDYLQNKKKDSQYVSHSSYCVIFAKLTNSGRENATLKLDSCVETLIFNKHGGIRFAWRDTAAAPPK
jgi:hypothetical protein